MGMAELTTPTKELPGGFTPKFHWRVLGTPSPVFPGFEVDICDRISDEHQPDAVWHRERAKGILRDHPEVKQLFGRSRLTAVWCIGLATIQVGIAIAVSYQPWWVMLLAAYVLGAIINVGVLFSEVQFLLPECKGQSSSLQVVTCSKL